VGQATAGAFHHIISVGTCVVTFNGGGNAGGRDTADSAGGPAAGGNERFRGVSGLKGRKVPKITVEEFNTIIREEILWAHDMGIVTDRIGVGTAILRLPFRSSMLRPGGTVAGPMMMALADACMYAVALSLIGTVKLAVTTNFNINFLFRAAPADLLAEGRILKLGKRLVVMEVTVHSEGHDEPVAHATGTYSIPPALTLTGV
jgi:uncharacterized protein (TIGR00369 family)